MATDATGTPTTNYSIPKLNTAVDSPTGKGINAMMDSIDSILASSFVGSPGGLVTGEALVWNGTTWARSSVTRILTVRPQDIDQTIAWTSYTPAWTSSGTQPALGNGTVNGRYQQIGKTVFASFRFAWGSTTTFGTGSYFFSLPVAAQASTYLPIGSALASDTGVASYAGIPIRTTGTNTTVTIYSAGGATSVAWGQTVPFTWGSTDDLGVSLVYEAA